MLHQIHGLHSSTSTGTGKLTREGHKLFYCGVMLQLAAPFYLLPWVLRSCMPYPFHQRTPFLDRIGQSRNDISGKCAAYEQARLSSTSSTTICVTATTVNTQRPLESMQQTADCLSQHSNFAVTPLTLPDLISTLKPSLYRRAHCLLQPQGAGYQLTYPKVC